MTDAFPICPYTPNDIAGLDSLMVRTAQRSIRLPGYTPNAMVLEDRQRAGVGVCSLLVDYTQYNLSYVTSALNDQGRLGSVSRALMQKQLAYCGNMPADQLQQHARFCRIVRQLSLAKTANILMQRGDISIDMQGNALMELLRRCEMTP